TATACGRCSSTQASIPCSIRSSRRAGSRSTGVRTTPTPTMVGGRPGRPSTTPSPHRVSPGSTPSTRNEPSEHTFGTLSSPTAGARDRRAVRDPRTDQLAPAVRAEQHPPLLPVKARTGGRRPSGDVVPGRTGGRDGTEGRPGTPFPTRPRTWGREGVPTSVLPVRGPAPVRPPPGKASPTSSPRRRDLPRPALRRRALPLPARDPLRRDRA